MARQVAVGPHNVDDVHEVLHHGLIPAVEVRLQELLQMRRLLNGAQNLRAGDQLLPDRGAVQRDHGQDNGVEHEVLELHKLRGSERRHHLQEQACGVLPIATVHEVDALVDLQLVPALPIAALAQLDLRAVDLLLGEAHVVEEKGDSDDRQDVVQLATDADGLLEGVLVALDGGVLVADPVVKVRLGDERITDLDVAEVLLRVRDLLLELRQVGLVLLLHLGLQRFIRRPQGSRTQVLLVVRQHRLLLHNRQDLRFKAVAIGALVAEQHVPLVRQADDGKQLFRLVIFHCHR
mmetsp:Transcript_123348/g.356493  ORF Transcript_123348/g.356493 Transcript_123348/m.356493 type:complete len:292 (+) Transcript_123348:568-1443(+)